MAIALTLMALGWAILWVNNTYWLYQILLIKFEQVGPEDLVFCTIIGFVVPAGMLILAMELDTLSKKKAPPRKHKDAGK